MDIDTLNKKVKYIIADVLAVDENKVVLDASFDTDLAADSLDYTALAAALEDEFDVKITNDELMEIKKVEDVLSILSKKLGIKK